MTNAIIEKQKNVSAHSHESLAREFGSIRAGRANASLLDRITVEYYGAPNTHLTNWLQSRFLKHVSF